MKPTKRSKTEPKLCPTPAPKKIQAFSKQHCFLFLFLVAFKDWIKLSSPETVWVKIYDRDSLGLDSFEKKKLHWGGLVCVFLLFFLRWEVKVKNTYTKKHKEQWRFIIWDLFIEIMASTCRQGTKILHLAWNSGFFDLTTWPSQTLANSIGILGGRRLGICFFRCLFWQETVLALSWPTSKWSVIHKVELGLQIYYLLNMNHFSWEFGDTKMWDTFRMFKTTCRNAQPGWPNRFRDPEWCMI